MKYTILTLRSQPQNLELFPKPMIVPNTIFPKGSQAAERNKVYVYTILSRQQLHKIIDYLMDNGIKIKDIQWGNVKLNP